MQEIKENFRHVKIDQRWPRQGAFGSKVTSFPFNWLPRGVISKVLKGKRKIREDK